LRGADTGQRQRNAHPRDRAPAPAARRMRPMRSCSSDMSMPPSLITPKRPADISAAIAPPAPPPR
jgi:hypothetical protein